MKWMKERDLLIAQTMAFVQSVTGKAPEADKMPEAGKTVAASGDPISVALLSVDRFEVERFEQASPAALTLPEIALSLVQTPPAGRASAVTPAPVAEVQARTVQAPIIEVSPEAPREVLSPVSFSRPDLSRPDLREDFQSEIRARVASFRAHQERFSREREAYCAATMAKVHAVLKESERPPPRSGK